MPRGIVLSQLLLCHVAVIPAEFSTAPSRYQHGDLRNSLQIVHRFVSPRSRAYPTVRQLMFGLHMPWQVCVLIPDGYVLFLPESHKHAVRLVDALYSDYYLLLCFCLFS